ncbi:helix-turn-helix domain-containing protein [Mucilaginibacter pedocola]|uniref:HTH cro/C1-type domain-containing protein n=1 Tax=Mucilaginibacter pedocola TaxID=1792845 RepID=A0A1S9PHL5_9SPHI|nr:hypothetical protein BC343_25450 [Mucilaginibacter pedocola]
MYDEVAIAKAIRERRLQLNYSQEYVAGELGLSQNAYSKLELGYTSITLFRFFAICLILKADTQELLKPCLPS